MSKIHRIKFKIKTHKDNFLGTVFNKKLVFVLLITLSIPITVILASQKQNLQNEAAQVSTPKTTGYIFIFKDKSLSLSDQRFNLSQVEVEKEKVNLETQHALAKENILNVLGASSFVPYSPGISPASLGEVQVMGEYTNVVNGIALKVTGTQALKIKKDSPFVQSIHPNLEVKGLINDSVPLVGADKVWEMKDSKGLGITGKGVNVAVIDSGVDYRNPDLGGSSSSQKFNSKVVGGYDFINNDDDPWDDNKHGSHVAGIIAGNGSLKGVAPDARIYAYKVLDSNAFGSYAAILSALDAVIATRYDQNTSNDISIVNLSVGVYCGTYSSNCGPDDILSLAVDNATNNGIISVVAAGNSGPNPGTINSPGTARKAITVGSINKSKSMSSFSSRGPVVEGNLTLQKPDILAPGESICSAKSSAYTGLECFDSNHVILNGTSMASPHVAGMAALIKQKYPSLNASEIKNLLTQNTTNLGFDLNSQGKGMLNGVKIFNAAFIPSVAPSPNIKKLTITAFQDSFVTVSNKSSNFGQSKVMKISATPNEIAYLKFDLSALAGKKINSAMLKIKIPNMSGAGSTDKFTIKKVNVGSWSEGNVKFNNKPTSGSQIATFIGKSAGNIIQVNVKNSVIADRGNKTSWMINSSGTNELILNSSEATSGRPQLIVEYE